MNTRFCKRLVSFAVLFCLIFVVSTATAVKPDKPGKPGKPDPGPPPNHALAIAGCKNSAFRVMDVDGGNSTRIARQVSSFPSIPMVWSPDGTKIIWSEGHYYRNLQMINADGSDRQEILASTDEMKPVIGGTHNLASSGFGCDGKQANLLYFLGMVTDDPLNWSFEDSWEEFYVLDLDDLSTLPVRLTNNELERHTNLAVSPDGQFIATWTYASSESLSDGRLEIRDVCGDDLLPVISSWTAEDLGQNPGSQFYYRIDWSSKDILAVSGRDEDNDYNIYLIDLLSEPITALKITGTGTGFGAGIDNFRQSWSPDGSQLAFKSGNEVYILDKDTWTFTFVVDSRSIRGLDWRPTWVANP